MQASVSTATQFSTSTGRPWDATSAIVDLHARGEQPCTNDYIAAITACAARGKHMKMMEVFRIAKHKKMIDEDVFNAMMDGFKECHRPKEALAFMATIASMGFEVSARTLNTALIAFALDHDKQGAYAMYEKMREEGVVPTLEAYHSLLEIAAKSGEVTEAAKLIDEMGKSGRDVDAYSFSFLLGACAKTKDYKRALKILSILDKRGIEADQACLAEAITALGEHGKWEEAERLYELAKDTYAVNDASTVKLYMGMCLAMTEGKQQRKAYKYYKELLACELYEPLSVSPDSDHMVLQLKDTPHAVLPVAVKACFDGLREDWIELKRRQRTESSGAPPRFSPLQILIPVEMDLSEARRTLNTSFGIKSDMQTLEEGPCLLVSSEEVLMWMRRGLK